MSSEQTTGTPEAAPRAKLTIAIIGTEGSGKTVLTATLAKKLSTINKRGVCLIPQDDRETQKYVDRVWQTLQDGDWPPPTRPGELFELRWKLQIVGEIESEVRLVDAAGQDLRQLFGKGRAADTSSHPEALRALAEYCRSADIVLFLINLKDFIGEGNPEQRTENEAAIKGAMDYLSADGQSKRFCLLFTQIDLYQDLAANKAEWLSLAEKAIPYIYAAYIKSKHVLIFLVSAVNKTMVVDESGVPRRMPKPGFGSIGFDKVVEWLTTQVREVQADLMAHVNAAPPKDTPPPDTSEKLPDWLQYAKEKLPDWLQYAKKYAWIGVVVLVLWFAISCLFPPPPPPPTTPVPELYDYVAECTPGTWFYDLVTVNGKVKNNGAFGHVIVKAWLVGENHSQEKQDFYLNAGQALPFTFSLHGNLGQNHKVEWNATVPK